MCGGVVGDFVEDVTGGLSDLGSSIDDTVNENIPGGWVGAALIAAGVYYAPEIGAYLSSEGAVLGATEAEAAANIGLTEGAIATPVTSGVATGVPLAELGAEAALSPVVAADVGSFGAVAPVTAEGAAAGGIGSVAGSAATGAAGAVGSGISSAVGGAGAGSILGQIAAATSIASGINGLTGGGLTSALGIGEKAPTAAEAQKMADPFSPYRSKLAEMYSGYLTGGNKTDITQMPGYSQFESGVLNPALEATKRAGSKSGMLMSGNEQIALQKQGQAGYYGFMTDYLNRLATGSGASVAPTQAANLGLAQGSSNAQGIMQGIGGVSTGLAGLFGGNSKPPTANIGPTTVGAGYYDPNAVEF